MVTTYYQNRKGDYQVLFPEELQEPVEINHEDDTLSIKLISENDTDVEMKKASVKNRKSNK